VSKLLITHADLEAAAAKLGCTVAAIQAVCEVEAPFGGFDSADRPRILFEGHKFSAATRGAFDKTNPTLSHPRWTRAWYAKGPTPDARNAGEHLRLSQACLLNREAALKSTSWGKFQILGANHAACGFDTLQQFINAMFDSEQAHLRAFVNFILHEGLQRHLQALRWADFAEAYNGPQYALNRYDTRLADAHRAALA
jgi:hypothetical protein